MIDLADFASLTDVQWRSHTEVERGIYIAEGDVALIDFATLGVTALTLNPYRDSYPLFAPDGQRVLFERRDRDPAFPKQEIGVVAAVSVP